MSRFGQAFAFVVKLYGLKAAFAYYGYLRRDPMALIHMRPGRENPYAIYDRMRAAGPIFPTRLGNWATTSHRVCNLVLRDRRFGITGEQQGDINLSFLEMNPPDHTRLRRLAQPAFSPRAMSGYQGKIEETVGRLLDRAAQSGRFDLVPALAAPLPIAVITDLLGVADADAEAFAEYGRVLGGAIDGVKSLGHARRLVANDAKLRAMFERLFALRRQEPRDDIVSRIVAAEGDQIEPHEMAPMCSLLLFAGFETTVNLIGNAVVALMEHPDTWKELCADPSLAGRVVDETLRYDPPVQRTFRMALEALEVEGKPVHRGQYFATLLGAANRDPEVYERPSTFDIHRENPVDHLAFSSGIHYCIGQPLAQLEATIALRMLAERMPGLRRVGKVKRRNSTTIRGPLHVPLAG
ncbi:MAG TPA: cytochrome P450 [Candidatus Limnocylindrales bacterium]|nr:cytochrome P450 [Candidatus Limnocylindrales bacterium]